VADPKTDLTHYIEDIEKAAFLRGSDEMRAKLEPTILEVIRLLSGIIGDHGEGTAIIGKGDDRQPRYRIVPREGSDQLKVFNVITDFPGQRGVEIAAHLPGVAERTVRTAIHRLKIRGAIYQNDGKWYPAKIVETINE
jgi:hypothetical protein